MGIALFGVWAASPILLVTVLERFVGETDSCGFANLSYPVITFFSPSLSFISFVNCNACNKFCGCSACTSLRIFNLNLDSKKLWRKLASMPEIIFDNSSLHL